MGDQSSVSTLRAVRTKTATADQEEILGPAPAPKLDFVAALDFVNSFAANPFAGSVRNSFAAYINGSRAILESIARDGYFDFVDSVFSDRLRAHDAADAILRLTVAFHSVVADLEADRLAPGDFGASDWALVTIAQVQQMALFRLRDPRFDVAAAAAALVADPAWKRAPIMLATPNGPKPIAFDETEKLFQRSLISYLMPNVAAEIVGADPVWKTLARAAASADPIRTALAVVHALHIGKGAMPALSGQVLPVLVEAARLNPFASVRVSHHDVAALQRLVAKGKIDGYSRLENGMYLTYVLKTPDVVAAEVRMMLASGALAHLSVADRSRLADLAKPGLADLLGSQDAMRAWREFGGMAIELTLVGFVSGGLGAFAEGVAVGAGAADKAVRLSRFLATSASFTTVMGLKSGDLSPGAFLRDAVMFKALAAGARFSKFLSGRLFAGGRFALAAQPIAFGVTGLTAASILTTYEALQQLALRDPILGGRLLERFVHNVALVSVLHGASAALHRIAPHTAPGSAAAREGAYLRAKLTVTAEKIEADLKAFGDAVAAQDPAKIEAALVALEKTSNGYDGLVADIIEFGRRTAPHLEGDLVRDIKQAHAELERYAYGDAASMARDPMRPQIAQGLARPLPEFVDLAPGEVAIFSQDLPQNAGIQAPRLPPADPATVRRGIVGEPIDWTVAYERIPKLTAHNVHGVGRYRLLSEGHNGSGPTVFYGQVHAEGRTRNVAIKVWEKFEAYEQKETVKARLLGALGVGPRVFGVVELPNGRKGLVMEAIAGEGDDVRAPTTAVIRDLRSAQQVMDAAGIAVADFQFLVTNQGRAVLMDAGGGTVKGEPSYDSYKTHMGDTIDLFERQLPQGAGSSGTP